jgi:glycerol-3-phosphate cytidylyltransferase-like family protein
MCDVLVLGVNSDADLLKTKGPTIMNNSERNEIMRHCKFVDEVIEETPYSPYLQFLDDINCQFYAHGDDPCFDSNGVEITQIFKD